MVKASGPSRVLLVDDDVMVARALGRLLWARGHEVTFAASAEEATGLIGGHPFEVVVSDIMMPGGGGIAMLRAAHAFDADLPVILITGSPTLESAMQAIDFSALMYLRKPLSKGILEDAVDRAAGQFRLAKRRRGALAVAELHASARATLGVSFANALDQLWMAYQPIVSWSKQQLFGLEALVRTGEPAFPNPGALLDAAEQLDTLDTLGRAIRGSVAATLAANGGNSVAFVNLHGRDLYDDSLYAAASPLSAFASRVVLELTERESIEHVDDLRARVARLRSLGYRIAIDDLGSGYAGLNAIVRLAPDIVKLDMALVRGVDLEPTKRKLIGSIVAVCRDIDVLVVAEGVETRSERDALLDAGCDLLQGYLLGRPQRSFSRTWVRLARAEAS